MEGEGEWTFAESLAWCRGYRDGDEPDLRSYESDEKEGWIVPTLYSQIEQNPEQYGRMVDLWFEDGVPNMRKLVGIFREKKWGPSILPPMDIDKWYLVEEKYSFERDAKRLDNLLPASSLSTVAKI